MKKNITMLCLIGMLALSACGDDNYYADKAESLKQEFNFKLQETKYIPNKSVVKTGKKIIKYYTNAIDKNDSVSKYYTERAWVNYRLGYLGLAKNDIKKAIKLSPNDAFNYYSYDYFNRDKSDFTEINKAIELDPKNSMYYNYRGNKYALLLLKDDIFWVKYKAVEVDSSNSMSLKNRWSKYSLSFENDKNSIDDNYKKALSDIQKAIELSPDNYDYYASMASLLSSAYKKGIYKDLDVIKKYMNDSIKYAKNEKDTISAISRIFISFKFLPETFVDKFSDELIVNLPDNLKYYVYLNLLDFIYFSSSKSKNYKDKLEATFNKALKYAYDDKQKFDLYSILGNYFLKINEVDNFKKLYEEYLKISDNFEDVVLFKFSFINLNSSNDIKEFVSNCDDLIDEALSKGVASYYIDDILLSALFSASKEYKDDFLGMLNKAIRSEPEEPFYYSLRADFLFSIGENKDALKDKRKFAELSNEYADYHSLANSYFFLHMYDEALDAINKAIELLDNDKFDILYAHIYGLKGSILIDMGRIDEAKNILTILEDYKAKYNHPGINDPLGVIKWKLSEN